MDLQSGTWYGNDNSLTTKEALSTVEIRDIWT